MTIEEQFKYDFLSWLEGILEDDPLPYGIKSVMIIVEKNNNYCDVKMSASDLGIINKLIPDFYYPLEAQFFYSKLIYTSDIFKLINCEELFKLLFESIKTNTRRLINNELKNKSIYIGFENETAKNIFFYSNI